MKRSGKVFIIAGVALAVVAGGLLFLFLSQMTQQAAVATTPTPVPDVEVMALNRDLAAGTVITGDMLRRVPKKAAEPGLADMVRDPSEAVGRMVITESKANQAIKRGDLQALPFVMAKGKKAMALSIDDLSAVAGLVREGDYVDVVISGKVKLVAPTPAAGKPQPGAKPQPRNEDESDDATILPVGDQTSVKAILQRVQVLKVVNPPPPAQSQQQQQQQAQQQQAQQAQVSGTPVAPASSQPPQGRITNAKAILVLGVTDQEAELLRFAVDTGGLQLVLRGRDDAEVEETKGMTLDILIRDYGLPVPKLVTVDANEPTEPPKQVAKP